MKACSAVLAVVSSLAAGASAFSVEPAKAHATLSTPSLFAAASKEQRSPLILKMGTEDNHQADLFEGIKREKKRHRIKKFLRNTSSKVGVACAMAGSCSCALILALVHQIDASARAKALIMTVATILYSALAFFCWRLFYYGPKKDDEGDADEYADGTDRSEWGVGFFITKITKGYYQNFGDPFFPTAVTDDSSPFGADSKSPVIVPRDQVAPGRSLAGFAGAASIFFAMYIAPSVAGAYWVILQETMK